MRARARTFSHIHTYTCKQPWSVRARMRVIALDVRGEETLAGIPDMEVSRTGKR